MEFSKEIFEPPSHGKLSNIVTIPYKGPAGKENDSKEKVKDLEVITNKKLELKITLKKLYY